MRFIFFLIGVCFWLTYLLSLGDDIPQEHMYTQGLLWFVIAAVCTAIDTLDKINSKLTGGGPNEGTTKSNARKCNCNSEP